MENEKIVAMQKDLDHILENKQGRPLHYCDLPSTVCPEKCHYYGGLCTSIKQIYTSDDPEWRQDVADMLKGKIEELKKS